LDDGKVDPYGKGSLSSVLIFFCKILLKSNSNFIKLVKIGMITFICKFISIFITALFGKKYSPLYGAIQNLPIYGLPIYAENPYMTGIYACHVWPHT